MLNLTSSVRNALLPVAARTVPRRFNQTDDTILVVQPDHLGDIILAQPAVRYLRDKYPTSRLVAIIGPWSREIVQIAWPVDDIEEVSFPGFTRSAEGSLIAPYRQLRHEARRLSLLRARTAYVLRPDAWWAAWLSALITPTVVTADNPLARRFANRIVPIDEDSHASARALRIAGGKSQPIQSAFDSYPLKLPVSEASANTARRVLSDRGVEQRFVAIHPGSGAAVKEWPVNRWRTVARAMAQRRLSVVLTGSAAEASLCEAIGDDIPDVVSLAGQTSVSTLAALLQRADIVIGPDCGPLHLAVAVGTPTVHIFGPSDPRRYGPWGSTDRHRVVHAGWSCPRCGDLSNQRSAACGCMLAVGPEDVIQVANSLLSHDVA